MNYKKFSIIERLQLYKFSQKSNQLFGSFLSELKIIANLCEFTYVDEICSRLYFNGHYKCRNAREIAER